MHLVLIVLMILSASALSAPNSPCSYGSISYPHSPNMPVVGKTLTCYCQNGKWIRCKENYNKGKEALSALEKRAKLSPKDFVFDLRDSMPTSSGLGGTIRPLDVDTFPSLKGQGISYSLFNIEPCGINLPHVHPRATELLFVISGNNLRTAFVEENSGRTIVNDIYSGQVTFFPEGLIHYQQNLDCKPAEYISALNSEDPGVVTISERTFSLPSEALQATFNLSEEKIHIIKAGIPAGPAKGRKECLKKCGLWHDETWIEDQWN